jgi:hypothetical protein
LNCSDFVTNWTGTGIGAAKFMGRPFERTAMKFKRLRRFLRRLVRRSRPDPWQFGLDVGDVMSARITRAMTGDLSAAEMRRMVLEKQSAGIRAHNVFAKAFWRGSPLTATREVFDIYHRAVRSNRKRLRKR